MTKKKAKSKTSLLVAEAVAATSAKRELTLQDKDEAFETGDIRSESVRVRCKRSVDILTAHLKPSVGKSSSLHSKPRVILTAEDALRLNVHGDDEVIIASLSDFCEKNPSSSNNFDMRRKVTALFVVPIEVFKGKLNVSDNSSPVVFRNDVSQQLPPGTIQFTSPAVLEVFESTPAQKNRSSQNMKIEVAPRATPTALPTPTSFSFKHVVQPSNSQSPIFSKAKDVTSGLYSKSWRLVHVLSCESTLGRGLLRRLSFYCSKVVVQIVDVNSKPIQPDRLFLADESLVSSSLPSALRILERLIFAQVVGSFVQLGQVLCISYVGKPFQIRIVDLLPCLNDARSVEDDFSELILDDDASVASKVSMSLVEALLSCNMQLYRICRSTKVSLIFEHHYGENATMHNDVSYHSRVVQPVALKQYLAGVSSTLQKVRSLLWTPLTQPELFAKRGMKSPRGLLLHGPCGVGKTSLAKQLSNEVSTEKDSWNCDVRYMHCASLQSKSSVIGEAEFALTRLFNTVNQKSTLIILDDVHLICRRRGSGSTETDRLAATLLALVDGIHSTRDSGAERNVILSQSNVYILAITSDPSLLDPALRRPGRLDIEVEVPLPEEISERAEILRFHANQFGIQAVDTLIGQNAWLDLSRFAKGFNGADCMLAAKEAVRLALTELHNSDIKIGHEHLISAIRGIKPSAIKSITVEIPQVRWSSIGGMDSVKRDLRESIELPLTHNEFFESLKTPPPRGILLYGPPGCSKTLMARALATEGSMNFLAVKGPELLSKWLGESERALSSLFRRARMAGPAIIFFDEIDAIAANRGSGDSASSGRLLSQLLTELDGINHTGSAAANSSKKRQLVVVVFATNRPDLLDTALTRPGRIDRMIYVGPPDAASRAQILQLNLQNVECGKDIDIATLASDDYSAGFSGAEMVAVCRDAALLALEEENLVTVRSMHAIGEDDEDPTPKIEMRHLLSAIQHMQRHITPEMIDFYSSYQESYFH